MFDINNLIRPNIKDLKPYSSARTEYTGANAIFLDANENPFNTPYNRYPDPVHKELRSRISKIKGIGPENIFLGNGSDEPIDLIMRAFCTPSIDKIITPDPTYGMYEVCARINDLSVIKIRLKDDYNLDVQGILNAVDDKTKLIYLCSPNNPTGNSIKEEDMIKVIENFNGLVVLDEAYIDFSYAEGLLTKLQKYSNLVILQTFSKAWGLAGIRLGIALASKEIIEVLYKIKYPYNLNILTQDLALEVLSNTNRKDDWVTEIIKQRENLLKALKELKFIQKIYPTEANFFLIKVEDPKKVYNYLVERKIILRDRSKVTLCEGCLRVTVGSDRDNKALVNTLTEIDAMKNEFFKID
jgi:histidinol-phosphate aminotransferase